MTKKESCKILFLWGFSFIVAIQSFFQQSKSPSRIANRVKLNNFPFTNDASKYIIESIGTFPALLQMFKVGKDLLPSKIENRHIEETVTTKYVSRIGLEEKIKLIMQKIPNGIYRIVYGPKGVGKTELVDHTALGIGAVIKLIITSAKSKDDIVAALSREVLGTDRAGITTKFLVEAIKSCEIIPTIIFDVERGGSLDQTMGIQAVRSLAKMLSPFCRCIIVVSEVNAILEFGQDNAREDFIFIDECSYSEGREILNNLDIQLTEIEIQYIFDMIGINPAMLIEMSEKFSDGVTVNEFISYKLGQARRDLLAFPHQTILEALKDNKFGVPPEYFNNRKIMV